MNAAHSSKLLALLLASATLTSVARAQDATDYRPWLSPALSQSPALRAFTVAPFADTDIKAGEILLRGSFAVSTNPNSITLKVVSATLANGETQEFDPPQGREIRLSQTTELWAAQKKRETINWAQVLDYSPVFVVGKDGGEGQPFVARKVDIVDGFIGDVLADPEFQQQLKELKNTEARRDQLLLGELPAHSMWLENVGVSQMTTGYGEAGIGKSVGNNPLRLGGQKHEHGIGTHAESELVIDLKGKATRFVSMVGVDEEIGSRGSVVFSVWADGRKVDGSTIMRVGDEPELLDVDLTGVKTLRLQITDAGDSVNSDHADWAGAYLELTPTTDLKNPSSLPSSINYSTINIPAPADENATFEPDAPADALWLESLDLGKMTSGYRRPNAGKSIDGNPLKLSGRVHPHGVGTHAPSRFAVRLGGVATRFVARVGVDDEIQTTGSVVFSVWVDGQEMANTGVIKAGNQPQFLSVNLTGASILELRATNADDGNNSDHADWGGALIQLVRGTGAGEAPVAVELSELEE